MSPAAEIDEILVTRRSEFLAFARSRTRSRAQAEDVVQEFTLKVLARAPETTVRSPVAWLYRVLRNTLIDHRRHESARSRGLAVLADEMAVVPPPETEAGPCGCVDAVLAGMSPEDTEIVRRAKLAGESHASIADRIGMSVGAVAVRLHRARRRLRQRLEARCVGCCPDDAFACGCGESRTVEHDACKETPPRSSFKARRYSAAVSPV